MSPPVSPTTLTTTLTTLLRSPSLSDKQKTMLFASSFYLLAPLLYHTLASEATSPPFFKVFNRNVVNPLRQLRYSTAGRRLCSSASSNASPSNDASNNKYLWLEQVNSPEAIQFGIDHNERTVRILGDPTSDDVNSIYMKTLKILNSTDKIVYGKKRGKYIYNFWTDATNIRGLWRRCALEDYLSGQGADIEWEICIDVDELGRVESESWVYKGFSDLDHKRDITLLNPTYDVQGSPNIGLVSLSPGGSDACVVREFDLVTKTFVPESSNPFKIASSKSNASYKSRDVLLIGTEITNTSPIPPTKSLSVDLENYWKKSLTSSGYPMTVREWTRGTSLTADSVEVFRGEFTDVSVGSYISDERGRVEDYNTDSVGDLVEVRYRSLTFYSSVYYVKVINTFDLLPLTSTLRQEQEIKTEFVQLDVQDDAQVDTFAGNMLISLRSDWTVSATGRSFKSGSLLSVNLKSFLQDKDKATFSILFEPDADNTVSLEDYSKLKSYIVLNTLVHVKSKIVHCKYLGSNNWDMLEKNPVTHSIDSAEIQGSNAWCYSDDSDEYWLTTKSYLVPTTLSLCSITEGKKEGKERIKSRVVKSLPHMFDSSTHRTTQLFARSKDGTMIPYFITSPKEMDLDGSNTVPTPTLLYGYGGFEISMNPRYLDVVGVSWLDKGGVYVDANIRGGGEYGPSWHQAAKRENRQKAFDDFIAVAEDLITRKICTAKTLGCRGGSNGGLLVGMMLVQRPDLFGAIECAVPLLDMERYHLLLAGASWTGEYGDPSVPSDWAFLKDYSPFHLIEKDGEYPPVLFTSSQKDDRVHPAHARKTVAKIMDLCNEEVKRKVFYFESMEGGHGGAADSKQVAWKGGLEWGFLWEALTGGLEKEEKE